MLAEVAVAVAVACGVPVVLVCWSSGVILVLLAHAVVQMHLHVSFLFWLHALRRYDSIDAVIDDIVGSVACSCFGAAGGLSRVPSHATAAAHAHGTTYPVGPHK